MMNQNRRKTDIPEQEPGPEFSTQRRSLVTDILALQLAITGVIALIAFVGLFWASQWVVQENLERRAELWAPELNELGAPLYLSDHDGALLGVETFIGTYPEILRVTWYSTDGSVFESVAHDGPIVDDSAVAMDEDSVATLAVMAGNSTAYELLPEEVEGDTRFRLVGPIWTESFANDGLFGFDPANPETAIDLLGFVAVDFDYAAYQSAFQKRFLLASLVLAALLFLSWTGGRELLKRALRPLSELQRPLHQVASGKLRVQFPSTHHRETQAIVTTLDDTLRALEKREEHLVHLADHDSLTGLFSRRRLAPELEDEITACATNKTESALCFVDLDQFKYINDTCGHPAGDQLLKLAADQLRRSVRSEDFVARFGGDEFVILLRNVSRPEAEEVANQVLERMRSLSHVEQGHLFRLQCSIGVASIDSSKFSAHELIAQADMACQTAKANGRNRVEMYQVSGRQSELMIEDVRWTRVIRTALEIGGFVLHYQPLMHVKTGIVAHYEALLRLKTENGLVGPLAFLPAAGRFGLMPEIDRWVVEHAVEALAECGTDGLTLSVNLSSYALEDNSFAEHVEDVLKRHGVEGHRIVFEITEQVAVRFAVETDERIGKLRDLGCRLAIDDFGTGYSSFSYLKHLPVDYLKIDGSFIKGVTDNQVDQSMVRMIGEVARAAGIETVAEYVQTEAELRMIAEFNIDYAQGFYIGRPDAKLRPLDVPHPLGADDSSPAHASLSALHR